MKMFVTYATIALCVGVSLSCAEPAPSWPDEPDLETIIADSSQQSSKVSTFPEDPTSELPPNLTTDEPPQNHDPVQTSQQNPSENSPKFRLPPPPLDLLSPQIILSRNGLLYILYRISEQPLDNHFMKQMTFFLSTLTDERVKQAYEPYLSGLQFLMKNHLAVKSFLDGVHQIRRMTLPQQSSGIEEP